MRPRKFANLVSIGRALVLTSLGGGRIFALGGDGSLLRAMPSPCGLRAIPLLTILAVGSPSSAAVTLVQKAGSSTTNALAYAKGFPSPNTAGNTIVVFASWSTPLFPTISDTAGNSYRAVPGTFNEGLS